MDEGNKRPSLNFGARAKRRSQSQRIGVTGEKMFELWGLEHGLASEKCGEDYGIDYTCQVLRKLANGSEEQTGTILAVQEIGRASCRERV